MNIYHIALFLHLVALIVAAAATAVTKLAVGRRIRARTVGEALEWHDILISSSKLFPICLATFLVTGASMLSVVGASAWANGFVVAGLAGVVLLFASGTFLGIKAKGLRRVLAGMAEMGKDAPAPNLAPPPLVTMLPVANTGIALAVVFDMVTKPASISIAVGVVVIAIVASFAMAWWQRPAAAHADAADPVEAQAA
jgi:hypothetical protein